MLVSLILLFFLATSGAAVQHTDYDGAMVDHANLISFLVMSKMKKRESKMTKKRTRKIKMRTSKIKKKRTSKMKKMTMPKIKKM